MRACEEFIEVYLEHIAAWRMRHVVSLEVLFLSKVKDLEAPVRCCTVACVSFVAENVSKQHVCATLLTQNQYAPIAVQRLVTPKAELRNNSVQIIGDVDIVSQACVITANGIQVTYLATTS